MILKYLKFNKEFLKCQKYNKNELKYRFAKSLFFDLRLSVIIRFYIYKFFLANYKNSIVSFNNICIISSNFKSVFKFLRMNRLFSKNFLNFAKWSGIRKSSW